MKTALLKSCIVPFVFAVGVMFTSGSSWPTVFWAFGGVIAGMAALLPMAEYFLHEDRIRAETEGAVAWIDQDAYGFSQRIADVYGDAIDSFEGDRLADVIQGADGLSLALAELSRRGKIRRHEELLRSRTWLP